MSFPVLRSLLLTLTALAAAGCAPDGKGLKWFQGKVLRLDADDPTVPNHQLVLEYDLSQGCEPVSSGVKAWHNGAALPRVGRGGAPEEGGCLLPGWYLPKPQNLGGPLSELTVEDGTERLSAGLKNLFVVPQVVARGGDRGRVGDTVAFEVSPGTEQLKDLKVFFVPAGAKEEDGIVWWDGTQGRIEIELSLLTITIPARQPQGTGRLLFTAAATAPFTSCVGFIECRATLGPMRVELPFTVVP